MIGSLMTYINSITTVKASFNSVVTLIFKLHQDSMFVENITVILDQGKKTKNDPGQKESKKKISVISKIELINVSFKYPQSSSYSLKNINLIFKEGNTYSLVGKNGSGKTTLIKVIMGFYPDEYEGTIKINGIDFKDIELESYRKAVSAVFQDFTNYQFKIENIISISDKQRINLEKVYESGEKAGITDFIDHLPNKYKQQVGSWFPGGIQLSGGEWQKLSIAKAIYRGQASLFIFDEPSSALDPLSEAKLYMKFNELAKT